jgi:hypothetical protein
MILGDNQGATALVSNPEYYARMKYIDIQWYFICEQVAARAVMLKYVSTIEMIADSLTKLLTHVKFEQFIKALSMKKGD